MGPSGAVEFWERMCRFPALICPFRRLRPDRQVL